MNAFTATLDQFNTSLLKKSIQIWLQTFERNTDSKWDAQTDYA